MANALWLGFGFRVQGFGFRFKGLGFRIQSVSSFLAEVGWSVLNFQAFLCGARGLSRLRCTVSQRLQYPLIKNIP